MTIFKYLLPLLVATAPVGVSSQTIDERQENGYLAPVTVIENHPQCNGAGETAFALSLDAPDLDFDLRGMDGDQVAYVGDARWDGRAEGRCYITQRRGVERTQIEIPCNASLTQAELQQRMDDLSVGLDFSGTLAICQSPTEKRLLEGSWAASLTVDGRQKTYEGEYAVSTEHFCRRSAADALGTRVAVTYANAGLIGYDDGPFERSAAAYHLRIRDMPIEIPDADPITVDLQTGATFYPVFEDAVACPKEGCGDRAAWSISAIGPTWWAHRQCR